MVGFDVLHLGEKEGSCECGVGSGYKRSLLSSGVVGVGTHAEGGFGRWSRYSLAQIRLAGKFT